MLNRSLEALDSYATILEMNEAENSYQKCNAALQSGLILEQLGEFDPAAEYFRLCLKLTPNKYEKSLHQKAKAGLNRLKK